MRPGQRIALGFIIATEMLALYIVPRVFGLIRAFNEIALIGNTRPAVVAVGISLDKYEIATFALMALPAAYAIISGLKLRSRY